jgi:phosphatidate cytidylyltransferase
MLRLVTGLLLILLFIYLVLLGPAWLLALAGVVFAQAALWEFFRMAEAVFDAPMLRVPAHAISALLMASALTGRFVEISIGLILLLVLMVLTAAMSERFDLARYLPITSGTILAVIYTTIPLCIFVWVKAQPGGAPLALFTMAIVWASDTTAYFVGKAVGQHLAFPRISPKKTWEGVAGSVAGALLVGFAGYVIFRDWTVIPFAVVVNIAAQFGDLAESAIKRSAGVKDSSQLVPGHGGVLDRMDALLFAAPVLWYYWLLTGR